MFVDLLQRRRVIGGAEEYDQTILYEYFFKLKNDCQKYIKKKIRRTSDHAVPSPNTFIFKANPAPKTQGKLLKSRRKNANGRETGSLV